MKKVIEYKLLVESSATELENDVSQYIWHGWQPYGWPFRMTESGWDYVAQAVVKYEEE